MSQGFFNAGFDVAYAVERDHDAAATLRLNHSDTLVYEECVFDWLDKVETKIQPIHPKEMWTIFMALHPAKAFRGQTELEASLIEPTMMQHLDLWRQSAFFSHQRQVWKMLMEFWMTENKIRPIHQG